MKTNMLLIVALFIMSAGVNAVAKEDPRNVGFAVVPVKGSSVYKVIYKNDGTTRVKLNIYNANGQVVFSETISTDGFIRPLNFAGLKAGEYTVEVSDGAIKRSEKVTFGERPAEPAVASSQSRIVHVAKLVRSDEKYLVSIANCKDDKFTVKIFGDNDTLLYNETSNVEHSDAKVYNVKNGKVNRIEIIDAVGAKTVKRF